MANYTFIADDDPVVIFLMGKLLEKTEFGQSKESFEDGASAFRRFHEMYNKGDAFIIFLDINMPEMDGWEFLEQIEEFASPENTFVIVITSSIDQPDAVRAGKNKFVKKFIVKPVLRQTVSELKDWIISELNISMPSSGTKPKKEF